MHPAPYLVPQKAEGGTYDLYQLPRETPKEISDNPESKRGLGLAACFVARNRFAVLDKNGMVYIRNLNNELTKTLKVPNSVDNIFYAGTGLLLLRTEESMALLDIQRKEVRGAGLKKQGTRGMRALRPMVGVSGWVCRSSRSSRWHRSSTSSGPTTCSTSHSSPSTVRGQGQRRGQGQGMEAGAGAGDGGRGRGGGWGGGWGQGKGACAGRGVGNAVRGDPAATNVAAQPPAP